MNVLSSLPWSVVALRRRWNGFPRWHPHRGTTNENGEAVDSELALDPEVRIVATRDEPLRTERRPARDGGREDRGTQGILNVVPGRGRRVETIRPRRLVLPLALWVALAVLAVANGVFRETVIAPQTSPYAAHVLSTLLLVAIVLVVSWWFFRDTDYTTGELVTVGVAWVVLTVLFEFGVGYVEEGSIDPVLAQYDVLSGQIWVLVLVALLLAPLAFGRWLVR